MLLFPLLLIAVALKTKTALFENLKLSVPPCDVMKVHQEVLSSSFRSILNVEFVGFEMKAIKFTLFQQELIFCQFFQKLKQKVMNLLSTHIKVIKYLVKELF